MSVPTTRVPRHDGLGHWRGRACLLFALACGSSWIAQTGAATTTAAAQEAARAPANLPIIVSGQSNAVNLFTPDAFPALYPKAICAGCLGNMPLSAWDRGTELWAQLEASLHQPITAFVHWEGETDYNLGNRHYATDERAFLGRVRAANKNPHLLVVLVEIIPYADNGFIRRAQEQVASADPNVVLVKMDGIPTDGENHLARQPATGNGYVQAAQRILEAIAARY